MFELVNPPALERPRGWNHGLLSDGGGRVLFVAGQTAADADGTVRSSDFVEQFDRALARTLAVVEAAGGAPESVGRMTVFVTDLDAYRSSLPALGEAWRTRMGRHYPAMTLVQVSGLVDPAARVEIEATAVISGPTPAG